MKSIEHAERVFRQHGGMMRTSSALAAGIHPRTFYRLRDLGMIEKVTRGLYRWSELPPLSDPDLVAIASRVPKGVICLISALVFHGITEQIAHEVHVAIPRGVKVPRIDWPRVRGFRFSVASYGSGIQEHTIDDVTVPIYSAAKTVADCFKFRNTVGKDTAVEALRLALGRGRAKPVEIERYARVCRVERVMAPYLEALL